MLTTATAVGKNRIHWSTLCVRSSAPVHGRTPPPGKLAARPSAQRNLLRIIYARNLIQYTTLKSSPFPVNYCVQQRFIKLKEYRKFTYKYVENFTNNHFLLNNKKRAFQRKTIRKFRICLYEQAKSISSQTYNVEAPFIQIFLFKIKPYVVYTGLRYSQYECDTCILSQPSTLS